MKKILLYLCILKLTLAHSFSQSLASEDIFAANSQQEIAAERLFQEKGKIKFTENKGQLVDQQNNILPHILFSSTHKNVHIYLTKTGIQYVWLKADPEQIVGSKTKGLAAYQLRLELTGANPEPLVVTEYPAPDFENFYLPHCPQGITQVRGYQKVTYKNVYPFVDFVVYSHDKGLKYDFIVRPGGRVADIRIKYAGNTGIQLQPNGSLEVKHALGYLTENSPVTFQVDGESQIEVPSHFVLTNDTITFNIPAYDSGKTLIIDPATVWGTYYSGEESDRFVAVATDRQGNVYVTGETSSSRGIAFNGFQNTMQANSEALLVKFNANGVRQWATYFGNAGEEYGNALTTDANGNLYLAGNTTSAGGISFNGHQNAYGGGNTTGDAFLASFNPDGARQWITYYGGTGEETGNGVAAFNGSVYLAGTTSSNNNIALNGQQNVLAGAKDAFLVKFTTGGERQWATYYGGSSEEEGFALAIDADENIYLTGSTKSLDNIDLSGHQAIFGGGEDAFLVKFNTAGRRQWSTYYGGLREEWGRAIAIDQDKNIYVCGRTGSNTGIAFRGHKNNYTSTGDGFLVKFNTNGSREWGTYYGEAGGDEARSVQVDNSGKVYLSGWTASDNGIAFNGFQNTRSGKTEAFIALFDATGSRQWASYYGSPEDDYGHGIALDQEGAVYLVGNTYSQTGLEIKNAHQPQNGGPTGSRDGFIVKISAASTPVVVALTPPDEATGIAPDADLVMRFNRTVTAGAGKISLFQNGDLFEEMDVKENPSISFSASIVTITPKEPFTSGADIYVLMPAGIFVDSANTGFSGITSNDTWNFTIQAAPADTTRPQITAFSPVNGAVNVDPDSELIITFSEAIQATAGKIRIFQNNTLLEEITANNLNLVTVSDKIVTIDPARDFTSGTEIYVLIENGAFTDLAGNLHPGITAATTWRFSIAANTTPDAIPPVITQLSPPDNAADVPANANLVITFSEIVTKGTGAVIISQNGVASVINITDPAITVEGAIVTIANTAGFLPGAEVYVQMPAGLFTDAAGNPFAGITDATSWNFTIISPADLNAPVTTAFTPADESMNVDAGEMLVITFDKNIRKGTGNIIITHGTTTQTIDVASEAVRINGNRVTINPPGNFPSGASVSVLILPGAFTDTAANPFAGITNAGIWNFTVMDYIAPALVSLFPAHNTSDVPANINLVLTFDEAVKKGAGQIVITQGAATQTIDIASSAVIVSGATVIINPPDDFPFDATIGIQIPAGAFTDLAGNPYAGFTDTDTWNLVISGFSDNIPPVAVALSPANNASLVPAGTDLEIIFSENVQKGKGSISINYDVTGLTVDVNSENITISGASVRINLDGSFPLGAQVHILVPEGAFMDLANNTFAGITQPSEWNFTVDAADPIRIVNTNFPEVILSSAASVNAFIEVDRLPAGTKTELVSKGIAAADWNRTSINAVDLRLMATLTKPQFDEIGLQYYFNLTFESGVEIASDTGYTYIQYTGSGLSVPNLQFGTTVNAYQMISIPLELQNKQVADVLENNLGEYNIKKWRFFTYDNNQLIEYKKGFTSIEAVQAYWLIAKDSAVVTTGEGTTLKVHSSNPYVMQLKKGWNQVGNPYNFNISWNDVRAYNKQPEGLGNLRVFDNGFNSSDILSRFSGAYVFADEAMDIQIPVLKNKAANGGRLAAGTEGNFDEHALWQVNFSLQSKEMNYSLGGLGMHPEAHISKDRFDDITVPRFIKYLEMNFSHPEYFAPKFTKDIRPVEENQVWDFTVEANIHPQFINLNWQKYLSQHMDRSKQLILYDVTHGKKINLGEQAQYTFYQDSLTVFKLFYGETSFIGEKLQAYETNLFNNYPNPLLGQTFFEFRLSQEAVSYQVRFQVFDLQGRLVATLKEGTMEAGLHQFIWEGKDTAGRSLPAGLYVYKLEAVSVDKSYVFTRKLIIR